MQNPSAACGSIQPNMPKHALASGKLLVQLEKAGVICTPRILLSTLAPAASKGFRGDLAIPRDHFNTAFVTWNWAVTSLCPREQVVFVSVCCEVWAGKGCRTRPLCPSWAGSEGIPSLLLPQGRDGPTDQAQGRSPPAPQSNPSRSCPGFPACGLGCIFQLSHRFPQILATGSCRACTDLFLLLIPAWTSAGLRAADPTPNTFFHPQWVPGFSWWSRARPGGDKPVREAGSSPGWVERCLGARGASSRCGSELGTLRG